ncbi:DNA-binding transcriptional regulator YafC [Mangrovibacter plantisponsor]|uniref:LysR family transcriptional regulator n=1 Tax=Mangrovibacter plantisponsor TaxID=451513 RepID=A0A317PUE0_9ENTR|nr:DNA-binding transcriptional regulator YafC [Mangrovibacter plantisponsor]PWW04719.1 LysR family transcriptional regulator [Mangrovibacter plantisponsor]
MKTNSEELGVFVAVVESGSFSRAAVQLNLANSAVSRAVKRLEMKLGVNLLNRTTRQLSLTEEGKRYFRRAQHILQEMADAENELQETKETPAGTLIVDAATPVILHLLVPLIKPFRERYPQVTLSLVSSETFINLIERKVDVAIRVGNLSDSSLRARPLFNSYRRIVATPEYLAVNGTPQTPEDLDAHCCIGFSEPLSLNSWAVPDENGQLRQISPALTSNNGETIKQLCLGGNGIASLSDFMVDEEITQGRLVEVLQAHKLAVPTPFSAVYYSDRAISARIRAFIDFLTERFADKAVLNAQLLQVKQKG